MVCESDYIKLRAKQYLEKKRRKILSEGETHFFFTVFLCIVVCTFSLYAVLGVKQASSDAVTAYHCYETGRITSY